jgi:hypothetical protein
MDVCSSGWFGVHTKPALARSSSSCSTATGCLSRSLSFSAIARPMVSVPPPAAIGTAGVIVRALSADGVCASETQQRQDDGGDLANATHPSFPS